MTDQTNTKSVKSKKLECIAAFIKTDPSEPFSPYKGNAVFIPKGYSGNDYKFTTIDIRCHDMESLIESFVRTILCLDPDADPKALLDESDKIFEEQQAEAGKGNDETTMEQPRSSKKKPCED